MSPVGHIKNGGLVKASPQNPLNSGLGIILICPDVGIYVMCSLFFVLNDTVEYTKDLYTYIYIYIFGSYLWVVSL